MVGDATVAVDEPLVKRALSNLLGNATRFAEPGSTVQVRIGADAVPHAGSEVEVLVQNRGQGIAPQQLPRLFDRFFRGDESRCCEGEQHHGLGLAIVAAITRMHAAERWRGRMTVSPRSASPWPPGTPQRESARGRIPRRLRLDGFADPRRH